MSFIVRGPQSSAAIAAVASGIVFALATPAGAQMEHYSNYYEPGNHCVFDELGGIGQWLCDGPPPGAAGARPQVRQVFVAIAIWRSPKGIGSYTSDKTATGSRQEAEQNALARCHRYTKDCELLGWAANQCIALAVSDRSDIGLAFHQSRKLATAKAMDQCKAKSADCYFKADVCSNDYPQR